MKILFHHRIASADGQFVHLTELVAALRRAGHVVEVVGPAVREESSLGHSSPLVRMLKRRVPPALYEVVELAYSAVATARLLAAALRFRPDAIYERYNLHLHAGRFVARLLGVKLLLEINAPLAEERHRYGGLALRGFADWSDRVVWNRADHLLPVTDVLADWLRAAGVPEQRITVIPNGADLRAYDALPDRAQARRQAGLPERTTLGFVGFVRHWHGLPAAVEALAQRPGLQLVVVGDGPDRGALEAHARALGVSDRVIVTGFVPRERVPACVAGFDVALQPAVTAYASPLKLFEYLAAGCAVVAPDQRNIREVLTHGRDALLFAPDDPASFAAALDRLCDDAALRDRLGRAGAALVREHPYTWDHNARVVTALIEGRRLPVERPAPSLRPTESVR